MARLATRRNRTKPIIGEAVFERLDSPRHAAFLGLPAARSSQEYVEPIALAHIFAGLRDTERTLDALERAFEERNSMIIAAPSMREYEFLRGEPRFQALLGRLRPG